MNARVAALRRKVDPAALAAFGCIILLLIAGSFYSTNFLSPDYLLQQLQVASFLGLIATGMMLVILLGQIDLSVPWTVTVGGMMSTGVTVFIPGGEHFRHPLRHRLRHGVRASSTASASPISASPR